MFFCLTAGAGSGEARLHVIIDTDAAADDLRAICMLIGNPRIETLAITTSEGALTPAGAAVKTTELLHHFNIKDIPVGVGRPLCITPPAWRQQSEQIPWGDGTANTAETTQPASGLIIQTLEEHNSGVTFLCFGTLTNLNDVLTAKPGLKQRIERIIWYNSSYSPLKGANYDADTISANKILAGGMQIDIVSGGGRQEIAINEQYIGTIASLNNRYAEKIAQTHSSGVLKPVTESSHMKMWDDLAVVYLFAPELFVSENINAATTINSITANTSTQIKETAIRILTLNK
ncbi:MAG: nucleoside hydrolase [Bacteroidales bacterium]|nr:nucleoside hydrolase [Bacteroidales bacterium]